MTVVVSSVNEGAISDVVEVSLVLSLKLRRELQIHIFPRLRGTVFVPHRGPMADAIAETSKPNDGSLALADVPWCFPHPRFWHD